VWADLEAIGYEVQPFILPAASVNAPHKRERIWFVAYTNHQRANEGFMQVQKTDGEVPERDNYAKFSNSGIFDAPNTNRSGQPSQKHGQNEPKQFAKNSFPNDWSNFPAESAVCSRNDGISDRLDSITFPKWRNESIKAAGNAIVPQVAYQIFKAINDYRNL
jgi:DNA (cytosine-5)-methyltransferase 1